MRPDMTLPQNLLARWPFQHRTESLERKTDVTGGVSEILGVQEWLIYPISPFHIHQSVIAKELGVGEWTTCGNKGVSISKSKPHGMLSIQADRTGGSQ